MKDKITAISAKPSVEVSERLLTLARSFRDAAKLIEDGKIIAGCFAAVEQMPEDGPIVHSAYSDEQARFTLLGATHNLAHKISIDLINN